MRDWASLIEKGWELPRFQSSFYYAEDGTYKKGFYGVNKTDGTEEVYFDVTGTGNFDRKRVVDESGARTRYYLNNFSWEKADD